MGVLSDLNELYKTGDDARVKKIFHAESAENAENEYNRLLQGEHFESASKRTASDRKMMAHEREVAYANYN